MVNKPCKSRTGCLNDVLLPFPLCSLDVLVGKIYLCLKKKKKLINFVSYWCVVIGFETVFTGMPVDIFEQFWPVSIRNSKVIAAIRKCQQIIPCILAVI